MANQSGLSGASVVTLLGDAGDPITLNVTDAMGIQKGDLLFISDGRIASGALFTTSGGAFIGIAAMEKEANDGSTTISAWTHGIFDLTTGNTGVTAGNYVASSGGNMIQDAGDGQGWGPKHIIGMALETDTDTAEVLIGGP